MCDLLQGEDPTLTGKMGAAYVSGMQHPNGTDGPLFVRNVAKQCAPLAPSLPPPSLPARMILTALGLRCSFAAYNLESNFAGQCTKADSDAKCLADANGQYRLSYDAPVSDADMMQTFLPAFESVVINASIRGIMCGE